MKTTDEKQILRNSRTNDSDPLDYHTKKCTEMIEYIKSGRDVYIQVERNVIETESGEIRLEEISPEYTPYISISVLTDEMLRYDAEMFRVADRETLFHTYRPYFISFIVPLDQNDLSTIADLGDNC